MSAESVRAGDRLTVSQAASECFVANGNANASMPISIDARPGRQGVTLGTARSDASGAFNETVVVPALTPGTYRLTLHGVSCDDGNASCSGVRIRSLRVVA